MPVGGRLASMSDENLKFLPPPIHWTRGREPSPFARSTAKDLHVPFLTVENKKDNGDLVKAGNQARAYMAGVLRFFHSLGITKVPVYTLITAGTIGVLIFGWCEEEEYRDDSEARFTVSPTRLYGID